MSTVITDPQTPLAQPTEQDVVLVPLYEYRELVEKSRQPEEEHPAVHAFREMLADVVEVEAVLARRVNKEYSIWTVVNEPSREVRNRIYDREWQLMDQYSDVGFLFHILEREGERLTDLISVDDFDLHLRFSKA